jgi:hypothetical protein
MKDSFYLLVLLESNKQPSIFLYNICLKESNLVANLEHSKSCRLRLQTYTLAFRQAEPMFTNLLNYLTLVTKVMLIVQLYFCIPPDSELRQLKSVFKFMEEMDTSMNIHVEDY